MKKYRIIKLEAEGYSLYLIQKRFLFFLWIDLTATGEYEDRFSSKHYYQTLEEARTALRKFNIKKTVIEEV